MTLGPVIASHSPLTSVLPILSTLGTFRIAQVRVGAGVPGSAGITVYNLALTSGLSTAGPKHAFHAHSRLLQCLMATCQVYWPTA
jgi:hypothetical protein